MKPSLCRSDTRILDKLQRPYGTWVQELYSMYLLNYKKVTSGRILLFGFISSGSQTPSAKARVCFPFQVGRGVLYLTVAWKLSYVVGYLWLIPNKHECVHVLFTASHVLECETNCIEQGRNWNVSYKRPSIADLTKHKYLVSDMQCTMNKDLNIVSAVRARDISCTGWPSRSWTWIELT